jgi:hypothetical protein
VIAGNLGLESSLQEEAARFPHRSGVERHETRLIAVLPILRPLGEGNGTVGKGGFRSVECDWVLAVEEPNMIVTLTDGDGAVMDKLHRRVEGRLGLLAQDSGIVLLEIIGEVVGDYERAVEAIDGQIWDAEVTTMEGRPAISSAGSTRLRARRSGYSRRSNPWPLRWNSSPAATPPWPTGSSPASGKGRCG